MIRFPTKRSFLSLFSQNGINQFPSPQLASTISLSPFSSSSNSSTSSLKLSNKNQNNARTSYITSLENKIFSSFLRLGFTPMAARFCSTAKPSPQGKYYVALKNMSYSQKSNEIFKLLTGLGVQIDQQDIVLKNRFDGKYSGDAYVVCHSEEDLNIILALDNTKVASRFIKAFPVTEDEFEKARIAIKPLSQEVISQVNNPNNFNRWNHLLEDHLGVVKLKRIPAGCQKEDIAAFFEGFKIVEDGIQISKEGNTCYAVFESRAEAQHARVTAEAKEVLKPIIFKDSNISILEGFLKQIDSENKGKKKRKKKVSEEQKVRVLLMRNVPATVTKEDVLKFFEGFELEEKDVTLRMSRTGAFLGKVQILFQSQEDVHKAFIKKNLSRLGDGDEYIELSDYWG